ncbi:hypothetical protein FA15DRAFT_328917 [Coprinopsis marcescibilis]|uniref:Cytochrome P450 n=1 Tax=Coprinopsis marcescibilis TaxID=230819 RepID=A0A5C3KYP1_COPMA|nr:hypothetical protein FA15DRAFT_328917 [Coprinopsis marcescibilis]
MLGSGTGATYACLNKARIPQFTYSRELDPMGNSISSQSVATSVPFFNPSLVIDGGSLPRIKHAVVLITVGYAAATLLFRILGYWTCHVRCLPGPPSSSFVYGNMKEIWQADNSVLHEKWVKEYGPTLRYKSFFGIDRFFTTDLKALNHMLANSHIYQKPPSVRYNLGRFLGNGVLLVEGDQHKQQRRVMVGLALVLEMSPSES